MVACAERLMLIHALVDGELDAANSVAIEAHLAGCTGCADEQRRLEALRAMLAEPALRVALPDRARAQIEAALARDRPSPEASLAPPARRSTGQRLALGQWWAAGAAGAVAASLALMVAMPQLTTQTTQDQLVASHVRSLLAAHLTDVATSDQHVVKPWFNGRIDFAPPVVDLAGQGFPLVGGRLDYVDSQVVAAIVYRRRLHLINLFIRPADRFASPISFASQRHGYSVLRWSRAGLEYWAVSDISPAELDQFERSIMRVTG